MSRVLVIDDSPDILESARQLLESEGHRVVTAIDGQSGLVAFKKERGWRGLRLYSDVSGDYTRDYVSPEDADTAGLNVFTRRDGAIRHFWRDEMENETADHGQDPRGTPDLMAPLWTMFDLTPEGRGADWYPKLQYPARQ